MHKSSFVLTRLVQATSAVAAFAVLANPNTALAQLQLPDIRLTGTVVALNGRPVPISVTPLHSQFRINRFETARLVKYTLLDSVPRDSLRREVARFAEPQVSTIDAVQGVIHHPAGLVALKAERDTVGFDHFNSWLATPKLPVPDRLSALVAQFDANVDIEKPSRVPRAEAMLKAMEQMGPPARRYVVSGHGTLVDAYYALGMRDSVISHAEKLLNMLLTDRVGYGTRMMALLNEFPLQLLVQAYSGLPDGTARIERLMDRLRAASTPTPEERAVMSPGDAQWTITRYQGGMERQLGRIRMIGQPGKALLAHAWLNAGTEVRQASPESRSVADGTVRLIEFGNTGCGPCKEALRPLGHIREAYRPKGVEVLYVTSTMGNWGPVIVTPQDEVARLKEFYVERLQVRFPVVVWAGDKQPAPENGMLPEPSPNDSAYNVSGTPHFVILDGKGRVRYVRTGANYEPDGHFDRELRRVLDFVLAESKLEGATPSKVLPLWQTSRSSQ